MSNLETVIEDQDYYEYVTTISDDVAVYACKRCGSLVIWDKLDKHNNLHALLSALVIPIP